MLGRDIDDVVRAAGNVHSRQIQGLRVHPAIDGHGKQLSELIAVDVGGSEDGLVDVLPAPDRIIVVGRDVDLSVEQPLRNRNTESLKSQPIPCLPKFIF